tara:strand:+ start:1066 stop:1410 length:345 start_codon:yes stop_codon:yes gene_type:complete
MTLFNKLILIASILIILPLTSNCQIRSGNFVKEGYGYYIDNEGNKYSGKIKVKSGFAHGMGEVTMPKIQIKTENSQNEDIYFDQIQKVVIESDTFLRVPGRTIKFTSSFSKEVM